MHDARDKCLGQIRTGSLNDRSKWTTNGLSCVDPNHDKLG